MINCFQVLHSKLTCATTEWRASSPQLQQAWSDESAPVSAWDGVTVGAEGRVVEIELRSKVGRCRLTVSKPDLKACLVSAISA